ncbi:MAG: MerR family transcriptional regulator, partial [Gemmatimonadota bacterium]
MTAPSRRPLPTVAKDSWKVGELARRTGLTVRALHHYDAIGLLIPSGRTPSGHRLYERDDVERLQQIQSLRLMGFPLDEVKRLLAGRGLSPRRKPVWRSGLRRSPSTWT